VPWPKDESKSSLPGGDKVTPEAHTQLYDAGDCEPIVFDDLSFYVHVSLHPLGQSSLGRQAMGVRIDMHSTGGWEPGDFVARFLNTRSTKYEVQKSTEGGNRMATKKVAAKAVKKVAKKAAKTAAKTKK